MMGEAHVKTAQDRPLETNVLNDERWFARQVARPCIARAHETAPIRSQAAKVFRDSWTRKGRLFMLVATPLEDGTAHLDSEEVSCLPEAARRKSVDSAVVKIVEIGFGTRSSRKYGDIRRPPDRWTHLGRRDMRQAKENQDRNELQDKLCTKERVPVHDSLGPVPQLRVSRKLPALFLFTACRSNGMRCVALIRRVAPGDKQIMHRSLSTR